MAERSWLDGGGWPGSLFQWPGASLGRDERARCRTVPLPAPVRVEAGKSYVVEWFPDERVARIRESESGGWVPHESGTVTSLCLSGLDRPLALRSVEVRPDPVEPDPPTAALLRAEFPRLSYRDEGWLLWVCAEPQALDPGLTFTDPVPSRFTSLGAVDRVSRPDEATVRVQGLVWRTTLRHLLDVVQDPGPPVNLLRYVTVVADRFDDAGRRCARLVAVRAAVQLYEWQPDEEWAVSLVTRDRVRAWCLPVDDPPCQCSCH